MPPRLGTGAPDYALFGLTSPGRGLKDSKDCVLLACVPRGLAGECSGAAEDPRRQPEASGFILWAAEVPARATVQDGCLAAPSVRARGPAGQDAEAAPFPGPASPRRPQRPRLPASRRVPDDGCMVHPFFQTHTKREGVCLRDEAASPQGKGLHATGEGEAAGQRRACFQRSPGHHGDTSGQKSLPRPARSPKFS